MSSEVLGIYLIFPGWSAQGAYVPSYRKETSRMQLDTQGHHCWHSQWGLIDLLIPADKTLWTRLLSLTDQPRLSVLHQINNAGQLEPRQVKTDSTEEAGSRRMWRVNQKYIGAGVIKDNGNWIEHTCPSSRPCKQNASLQAFSEHMHHHVILTSHQRPAH